MLDKIKAIIFTTIIFICTYANADYASLSIKSDNTLLKQFSKEQLLSRADLETITVIGNPAFNYSSHTYQAFKLCDLLKNFTIPATANIEFKALDGYVTIIPAPLILQCKPDLDTAYLAIEPSGKWPACGSSRG